MTLFFERHRMISLDSIRGFDMFWIIGGDFLIHHIAAVTGWSGLVLMSNQLHHVSWQGFHAYDLVFPLFMFVSGISLVLSIEKKTATTEGFSKEDRLNFLGKAGKRAAILIVLGIVYNFGWSMEADKFRVASVLGQIGVAYLVSAFVFVKLHNWHGWLASLCFILMLVAFLQLSFSVPNVGSGVLTPDGIVNGWIDRLFLPGRLYGGSYDPEGILSVFSSCSVTLLGGLVGKILIKYKEKNILSGVVILCIFGGSLIMAGWAISPYYPIIKAAWTVSFNLVAAGISTLLFTLFYGIIDILHYQRWSIFFSVIGMNSIGIYLGARFISYPILLLTNEGNVFDQPFVAIPLVIMVIAVEWLVLRLCFKRRWFLKV